MLQQSAGQNQMLVNSIGKSQKKEIKLNQEIKSLQTKYEKQIAHFKENMENQRSLMNHVGEMRKATLNCPNCQEKSSQGFMKEKTHHPADYNIDEDFDLDGPIRDEHVRIRGSR